MSGATSNWSPGREVSPFRSLDEFRAENERLLTTYQGLPKPPSLNEMIGRLRAHIARGRLTGACLSSYQDRWEVQSLLDYWVAVFYREGLAPPETTLVDYQPELASGLADDDCPYVTLTVFRFDLRDPCYGREETLNQLVDALKASRGLLMVVGPSGGDKSLVVLGGLLPALRSGDLIPESTGWEYLPVVMPGRDPLADLANALAKSQSERTTVAIREQAQKFRREPSKFSERLRALGVDEGPVVLVIDRLEELYLRDAPAADRKALFQNLSYLVRTSPKARVIITVDRPGLAQVLSECAELRTASALPIKHRVGPSVAQSRKLFKQIKLAESRDITKYTEVLLPPMSQAEIFRAVMKPAGFFRF